MSPTFPLCLPSLREGSGFVPLLFSGLSSLPQFALAAFPASSYLIPWTDCLYYIIQPGSSFLPGL